MNEALGYYPLMTLATEDVLQNALDVYGEQEAAKLKPYLDAACDHVARKWDNGYDAFGVAVDWALENALAYAEDDGITLTIPSDTHHFNNGETHAPLPYRPYAE